MPTSDFQFLSDREREYLDDPEAFDEQKRAEIRYRLRLKFRETKDEFADLYQNHELWDTKVRTGDVRAKCMYCGSKRSFPRYNFKEIDKTTIRSAWPAPLEPMMLTGKAAERLREGGSPPTRRSVCASCWNEIREGGEEIALEKGLLPCAKCQRYDSEPDYHEISTDPKHFDWVPFEKDELRDLKQQWEDARHRVCPDCGKPQSELSEGVYEGGDRHRSYEFEGLVCDCGWAGPEYTLSFVKK